MKPGARGSMRALYLLVQSGNLTVLAAFRFALQTSSQWMSGHVSWLQGDQLQCFAEAYRLRIWLVLCISSESETISFEEEEGLPPFLYESQRFAATASFGLVEPVLPEAANVSKHKILLCTWHCCRPVIIIYIIYALTGNHTPLYEIIIRKCNRYHNLA